MKKSRLSSDRSATSLPSSRCRSRCCSLEWHDTAGGKQPYYFTRADDAPVTTAGPWDEWRDKASGESLESCTMIIIAANDFVTEVQHACDRLGIQLRAGDRGAKASLHHASRAVVEVSLRSRDCGGHGLQAGPQAERGIQVGVWDTVVLRSRVPGAAQRHADKFTQSAQA